MQRPRLVFEDSRASAREIGVWITDIQKRTASAVSVAERRLVKMKEEA